MEAEFFLWGLNINDNLTTKLAGQVSLVALFVAVLCFICSYVYNHGNHSLSALLTPDENKFPDYNEIARGFVLILCIGVYIPISQVIVGTIDVINYSTSLDSEFQEQFNEYVVAFAEINETDQVLEKGLENEIKDNNELTDYANKELGRTEADNDGENITLGTIANILSQALLPTNLVSVGIHAIAALIVGIIKLIILGITTVIIKVLIIVGPLAFAFSILPVFEKQLSLWFGTIMTAGMVFTTINILDGVMYSTLQYIFSNKDLIKSVTSFGDILALDICMIALYCSSFWITSKYVGRGDAGRVISKLVGIATALTALAASGGASAAASGGTLANVAQTGKNAITDK